MITIVRSTSSPLIGQRLLKLINHVHGALAIDEKARNELARVMLEALKKLDGVVHHVEQLARIHEEQRALPVDLAQFGEAAIADQTTGAEREFEAVLVEAKSTLDVLVPILKPVARLAASGFNAKGERLRKELLNNLPDRLKHVGAAFADWLEIEAKRWLGDMIDYRDRINHHRPVRSSGFVRRKVGDGVSLQEPIGENGVSLLGYARTVHKNLEGFLEEFIAWSIRLALPSGIFLVHVDGAPDSECQYAIVT